MSEFPKNSILIVGNAQTTADNPINHQYNGFFISFVVDGDKGTILDCSTSMVLELTNRFVRDFFVGRHIIRDETHITAEVHDRYYGSSRKAIVVAYKDALKKFRERGETKKA